MKMIRQKFFSLNSFKGHTAVIASLAACSGLLSSVLMANAAQAGEVDPSLVAAQKLTPQGIMPVIVKLDSEKPVSAYAAQLQALPRNARPGKLKAMMQADYEAVAQKVRPKLGALFARETQQLWLMHSMKIDVPRNQINALAALPGVKLVTTDMSIRSGQRSGINMMPIAKERALAEAAAAAGKPASTVRKQAPASPYHSAVDAFNAGEALSLPAHYLALDVPAAWQQANARGKGVTVAIVDSGVDMRSTAIAQGFRARAGDWFDPYGERSVPTDHEGHGTYVAGLLVGDVISSRTQPVEAVPVGIAPDAKWIAARIYDDGGRGSLSAIQRIYQWLLDPDGKPETPDAPDIVNNSWGMPQTAGRCDLSMSRAIEALRAADIHVVFAAGNDGPDENTSISPANYPNVLSVGALRAKHEASRRSSRGPQSACAGAGSYPVLWTVGENLPALDRMAAAAGTTGQADGTSFAAAVVSGALAVLRSAAPEASSKSVEDALIKSVPASNDAAAKMNFQSPQLPQALAVLTGKPATATPVKPLKLRWRPVLATGETQLALNAQTLSKVLPWQEQITALTGDGVEAKGANDWQLKAALDKPVMLSAKSSAGRDYQIEVIAHAEQTAASASASNVKREAARTMINQPVRITLEGAAVAGAAGASASFKQGLRLSSPNRGGRVALIQSGQVEYTPPKDFVGTDQFTYSLPQPDGKPGPTHLVTVLVQR